MKENQHHSETLRPPRDIQVITFDPRYITDFVSLNREWIERYFQIEAMDLAQLENPVESILKDGGEIFFILMNKAVVGTCAMIPHGPGCYELAKMAVDPTARGKKFGDLLMITALDWAKSRQATKVILLSNTVLKPAISLYEKHGFKTVHLGNHPDYERCNIVMEQELV
jgi:GNAT superfamily N-acetyltransferase